MTTYLPATLPQDAGHFSACDMTFTSITVHRLTEDPHRLTFWEDGLARLEGTAGPHNGSWQARFPNGAASLLGSLLSSIDARPAKKPEGAVMLTVQTGKRSASYSVQSLPVWHIVTLLEGLSAGAVWTPIDEAGQHDWSGWASAVPLLMVNREVVAKGLGRRKSLIVLTGSVASTSTAASLEPVYQRQRAQLIADGGFELEGDRYLLRRHVLFPSPSAAASVLAGSNTNGRKVWVDTLGRAWGNLADAG